MTTQLLVKAGMTLEQFLAKNQARIRQIRRISLICLISLAAGSALPARAEEKRAEAKITPAEILKSVRMDQASQHRVLKGALRTDSRSIPFRLVLNGPEIRYEFSNPDQTIALKMGEKGSRLEEVTSKGANRVTGAKLDARVRGTDITYEDLSLQFLYWKDAKFLPQDSIAGFACHKLELHPERGSGSQYGTVYAWIGVRSGALAQAECYAPNGKLAARFKVVSGRKLSDGTWIFKEMRIERFENGERKDATPTYLAITGEIQ